jgi:ABC-2 type transport system permease protein
MNTSVLGAVFKRNFVSYFANPTGYVFICVFVLLGSFAAFWPNEFFNSNLANLDQLNKVFPFIMLVFIPAITMSVWADERRQGTDELLLTIPANDIDIVVGKYLAAVMIYTVSLLFSLVCNFLVLAILGSPDAGLFLATYIGYWFVGLAMLAVGIVASFLTGNLTVSYILGAMFNLPLVFAVMADVILPTPMALAVKGWSIGERFAGFGRGVVSFSGAFYFLAVVVIALYLCMVLIGRRHWNRSRDASGLALQFLVRTLSLVVAALALSLFFEHHNPRVDISSEGLSSLSPETIKLLSGLKLERPVQIEAFISPNVPESYIQTRLNLMTMLDEIAVRAGPKVQLRINSTERHSEQAELADKRFGISARRVMSNEHGAFSEDYIYLSVAMNCGLEKVVLPFIDRGIPVEYELVRSICTVTQQKRKKIGVLATDAQLYGQFNMQAMSAGSNWPIVDELEKQYELVQVDPTNAITERYDALLAVQPSSLGPEQMDHFVEAVKNGQPTVIFEDPFPAFAANVPGTSAPKRPAGNPMMGMGQPPQPKGDIHALWSLLGINFSDDQIVWQDYNPYPKLSFLDRDKEFVFVGEGSGAKEPFGNADRASAGLQSVLLPFPGSMVKLNTSDLSFTPLMRTSDKSGTVAYGDMLQMSPFGQPGGLNPERRRMLGSTDYILAAHIQGRLKSSPAEDKGKDAKKNAAAKKGAEIDVIVVADIDMISEQFFRMREMGDVAEQGIHFDFDNVTFVLNCLDEVAGDTRFIALRKRRPMYRTLTGVEAITAEQRKATDELIQQATTEFNKAKDQEDRESQKDIEKFQKDLAQGGKVADAMQVVQLSVRTRERRKEAKIEQMKQDLERKIDAIQTRQNLSIQKIQRTYKCWAVLLPPVLPLLLALGVFLNRRAQEHEGVSRSRLRS